MKKVLFLLLVFLISINKVCAFNSSARSVIVMDTDTNQIIYQNNANEVRSVASISKIMTCILAIESNKLDDIVLIGEEINKAYGSGIYIQIGEEILLKDLLYGLMLRSGNDAALAIANYVGGDVESFVKMMNEKADEIGMKNTTFNNPHGLDEEKGNMSTAYDMALLTSYAIKNDIFKEISGTKKHTVKTNKNYYSWTNKNKLLFDYKYTTGGKTGFTKIAKRTLVTTASKDNINLTIVTLNDGNDFLDHKNLYEEVFNNYTKYRVLKKGNINILNETYYIKNKLYVSENFDVLLPNNGDYKATLHFKLLKKENFYSDEQVGNVTLTINGKKVNEQPIYVLIIHEKKSFFERIKDWLNGK